MKKFLNRRVITLILALVLVALCFVPAVQITGPETTQTLTLANSQVEAELTYDETTLKKATYYTPEVNRIELAGEIALMAFVLMAIAAALSLRWRGVPEVLALAFALVGTLMVVYHALMLNALPVVEAWQIQLNLLPWVMSAFGLLAILNLYGQHPHAQKLVIYLLCITLSLLALIPFWSMVVNATRSTEEINRGISLLPSKYLAYNWEVLNRLSFDAVTGFSNSLLIAISSTALTLYFSALTAYAFIAYRFRGRNWIFTAIVGSMMIPGMVGSIGYYQAIYRIGWTDSFWPLILPSIASSGTVFYFRQYLEANYHSEMTEAARVDGSGEWHTFNVIILPMMGPVLAISGISSFVGAWNSYFTPLMILSKPEKLTIPLMVQQMTGNDYRTEYGSLYLGLTLAAIPLFVVYGALSRFIVRGVSLGAVKG